MSGLLGIAGFGILCVRCLQRRKFARLVRGEGWVCLNCVKAEDQGA